MRQVREHIQVDLPERHERRQHDDHRRQRAARAAQHAGVNVIDGAHDVERAHHHQEDGAVIQHVLLRVEDRNQAAAEQNHRYAQTHAHNRGHAHRDLQTLLRPRPLTRAEVLAGKRRRRKADGADGQKRKLVDLAVCRPARHAIRAEHVDVALHEHVREAGDERLNG